MSIYLHGVEVLNRCEFLLARLCHWFLDAICRCCPKQPSRLNIAEPLSMNGLPCTSDITSILHRPTRPLPCLALCKGGIPHAQPFGDWQFRVRSSPHVTCQIWRYAQGCGRFQLEPKVLQCWQQIETHLWCVAGLIAAAAVVVGGSALTAWFWIGNKRGADAKPASLVRSADINCSWLAAASSAVAGSSVLHQRLSREAYC